MVKIKREKLISFILSLSLLIFFSLITLSEVTLENECRIGVFIVTISLILIWYKNKRVTGGLIFEICLVVMHYGQVIMMAFNMEFPEKLENCIALGELFPNSKEVVYITTLSILVSIIIVILIEKDSKNKKKIENEKRYELSSITWGIVIILTVLTLISDIIRAINVSKYGYVKGFQQKNIILFYADMMFPLVYFFLISIFQEDSKAIKRIIICVICRELACAFFIGSRGEAILDIVMCVLAILSISNNKDLKKKITKLFIEICIVGMIVLPFTGMQREKHISFNKFISNINPIAYCLTEFGQSIENIQISYVINDKPEVTEFFKSFLVILPSSTFIFPELNITYGNAYAKYLNNFLRDNVGAGLGGSLIGEGVFWFGSGIGVYLYICIFTIILTIALNLLNTEDYTKSIEKNTIILYLIYNMFYQIRGSISSFQTGIKILIYFYILFRIFKRYLYKNDTYNSKSN